MSTFKTRIFFGFTPIGRSRIKVLPFTRPLRCYKRRSTISFYHAKSTYNRHNSIPRNHINVNRSSKFRSFLHNFHKRFRLFIIRSHISKRRKPMVSIRIRIARLAAYLVMFISRFFKVRIGYTHRSAWFKVLIRLISNSISFTFGATDINFTRI